MNIYLQLILEGIALGLMLSVMMGPIFVAITQSTIEKGSRAGLTVGSGVWTSDIIIISTTYFFVHKISHVVNDGTFQFWMGMLGGIVLMVFGISAMLKKIDTSVEDHSYSAVTFAGFWLKGFLVNTVNPFTFIFWIGVISTYIIGKRINGQEASVFLATIMLVIITGDIFKVILAKFLRKKMKEGVIQWVVKGAGFLLFIFGLVLIYRVNQ